MSEINKENVDNIMEREIYTLTDEEGNEIDFELIGKAELEGTEYYALIPAEDDNEDGEFCEYTILKSVMENNEQMLVSIDDDDEFDNVADYFDDLFSEEIDYGSDN